VPRAGWLALGGLIAAVGCATAADWAAIAGVATVGAALIGGTLGVILARLLRRTRLAFIAIGVLTVGVRLALGLAVAGQAPPPGPLPAGDGAWQASVVRLGSTDGAMQRALLLVVPEPGSAPNAQPDAARGPWPVYAWLPRYPAIAAGDVIAFDGSLEAAPDGPGFGDVLRSQGAVASIRPRSFALVPVDRGLLGGIEPIRHAAGERLFAVLPQREAGLAAGILVGLRELVDRAVAASFTTAGLSHIVAISGWNIAQVAAVIVSMLRWLPRRPRSLIVIAAICVYTLLAGASASVVRAAVMGAVALLARESGRRGGAPTALALAVWFLVMAEPAIATDIGFQLSSAATAGLLAWATPLQERFAARAWKRVPGWLVETMAVSTAAQASTLPLVLFHFGRLSLVSPLANLVAAPLIAPVMLLSLVALIAGVVAAVGVPVIVLAPAILVSWAGLAALIAIADVSAALPFASVTLPPPLDLVGALLTAVAVFAGGTPIGRAWLRRHLARFGRPSGQRGHTAVTAPVRAVQPKRASPDRRLMKLAAVLATVLILGSAAIVAARPDGRIRITALDVGQGDAILVEADRGARMLIDGGPDPDVLMRRLDEQIPSWDRRLDLLVLSHPHEDHVGGLPVLLQRYHVGTIVDTGMLGNGPADHAFRQQLARLGTATVKLAAGDHVQLDGASASVLWPRANEVPLHPANSGNAVNDVSIVFDIRFGDRRFLLTGDVEQEIDPELLGEGIGGKGQPRVDLLKVAHHGSKTASTDAFLQAIQPRAAFVSAGIGNPYGHPAPGTIQRLKDAGADVYRTDTDGTLTATSDGADFAVSVSGPHAPPPTKRPDPTARALAFSCDILRPAVSLASYVVPPVAPLGVGVALSRNLARTPAAWPPLHTTLARPGDLHVRQQLVIRGAPSDGGSPAPEPPCYDRQDDRPVSRAGRRRPAGPASGAAPPPPHDRDRGDLGLPRHAHGQTGRAH
jgi:competence protein ComEC